MMREDLKRYPEFKKAQVNVGGNRGGSMGGQATIDYEIYGYNFEETDSVASRLVKILNDIPGTADVMVSRSDYQPEYQVDFDREKLAIYGRRPHICATASTAASRLNSAKTARSTTSR